MSRHIVAVTVGRSDYGIFRPVLNELQADPAFRLQLVVGGMHLPAEFGATVREIEADGRDIAERVDMLLASDTPEACAKAMGLGMIGFAQAFARLNPDIVLVLGDRFEMHTAVVTATPFNLPIAHLHGGELSYGAIDDSYRHSITKLSHLHFVATEDFGRRIVQMGEEPWRVTVSGAPSLDNLRGKTLPDRCEIERRFGICLTEPPLLVTFHPVTRQPNDSRAEADELLAALKGGGLPVIFTAPNADSGGQAVRIAIEEFVRQNERAMLIESFGSSFYLGMLAQARALVGNSSSGLIEAPSFKLPAVNIGERQLGRTRAANIIDVSADRGSIAAGIAKAISPEFRASLVDLVNPYGDGHAAERIAQVLREIPLDARLTAKRFRDQRE